MFFLGLCSSLGNANILFSMCQQLDGAVKQRNLSETQTYYQDTTVILQEVMDRMAWITQSVQFTTANLVTNAHVFPSIFKFTLVTTMTILYF